MFAWTPELDAMCPPLRGQGTPPTTKPLDDKQLVAAAGAPGASFAMPVDEAELSLIAICAKGDKLVDAVVDRWFAKYGARGAIEILALVGSKRPSPVTLMGQTRGLLLRRTRHHLAHAPDYAAALDFASAHDGLPPGMQAATSGGMQSWMTNSGRYVLGREAIAYVFPDHRPFFDAAVAQLEAQKFTTSHLAGAVATDDDVGRLHACGIGYGDWDRNALHVAHVTKEAGFARLAEYTARSTQVEGVARALTAYVSPEAAATLVLYIEEKAALPILRAYFTAHPELRTVLEPLATSKKKKVRETAASLLAA